MNTLYNIHNNPFVKYSAEEELEDWSAEVVPKPEYNYWQMKNAWWRKK